MTTTSILPVKTRTRMDVTAVTTSTIAVARTVLKEHHFRSSFQNKKQMTEYLRSIRWAFDFPWRDEQKEVLEQFRVNKTRCLVGNCFFGTGKTTLLLGMLNMGYWEGLFDLDETVLCAFNVCIRNEIRQKIKQWGSKQKAMVRTFDSLVYELCRYYDYPHLKIPNYKEKRIFVYDKCKEHDKGEVAFLEYRNIKYVFVDESQDLDEGAFDVFIKMFPNASFVFVGDVFQSIQKEPRESLLYYLSCVYRYRDDKKHLFSYFDMKTTPRVPKQILGQIQESLISVYPECSGQIRSWKSSRVAASGKTITWIPFASYKTVYQIMFDFIKKYPVGKSMVLTFSSCITVRGSLGDLARIRKMIEQKTDVPLNKNYKRMEKDKLFLSTVNSSKGLEREYVFILSTFPLEKAFINFSDDLTTNLMTVGVSRTLEKVYVCVPKDPAKFSSCFREYVDCPSPEQNPKSVPVTCPEDTKPPGDGPPSTNLTQPVSDMSVLSFMELEHNVTELLRQGIIEYTNRIYFRSFVKKATYTEVLPAGSVPVPPKSCLKTEEERMFMGVCVEILITASWTGNLPYPPDIKNIEQNAYYAHCIDRIRKVRQAYLKEYHKANKTFERKSFRSFQIIFLYTEMFVAYQHKIFFRFTDSNKKELFDYWIRYADQVFYKKPCDADKRTFNTQVNVRMELLTGIADGTCNCTEEKMKRVFEIKASTAPNWKEDAFIQAFCYGVMLGQSRFGVRLINLFKNQCADFVVAMPDVKWTRRKIYYDILNWNISAFLSKKSREASVSSTFIRLRLANYFFVGYNSENQEFISVRLLSPTKTYIDFHSQSEEDTRVYIEKRRTGTATLLFVGSHTEFPDIQDVSAVFNVNILKHEMTPQVCLEESGQMGVETDCGTLLMDVLNVVCSILVHMSKNDV